jgi:hypothetical protein
MARRPKQQKTKAWQPMQRGILNPRYVETVYDGKIPDGIRVEVWSNDTYEATVEHHLTEDGEEWAYITLKRYDRHAVRDWRHLQSIKNEVTDPEREAMELFPAESRLMDEANQYHLWVLPVGAEIGFGQRERCVKHPEDVRGLGKARQRAWQPGLSTGPEVE